MHGGGALPLPLFSLSFMKNLAAMCRHCGHDQRTAGRSPANRHKQPQTTTSRPPTMSAKPEAPTNGNAGGSGRATSPTPAGSGAAVSAATYGKIDASSVGKPAWMTRIPPKLAQAFDEAPEGTVLGTFTFTKGGTLPAPPTNGNKPDAKSTNSSSSSSSSSNKVDQTLSIRVSEELAAKAPDLPVEYTIEALTRKVPTLHPFTRRPDGSIELHATVAKTGNLQMVAGAERYRNLCKNRLVQSATTDRFVKPVDLADLTSAGKSVGGSGRRGAATGGSRVSSSITNTGANGSSSGGFGDSVQQFGRAILDSQKAGLEGDLAGRKRKFEGQSIRGVVFELFSMQRYWTVKDMRSASGRAEKELREVLSDLAHFHRSGENKGSWELREEFRKGTTAEKK